MAYGNTETTSLFRSINWGGGSVLSIMVYLISVITGFILRRRNQEVNLPHYFLYMECLDATI